jgi:hypothetical protein
MDKYPIARDRIVKHFGSVSRFCRETEIPKATVIRVLGGNYGQRGTDDTGQRRRIEASMREHGVPEADLRNLWAVIKEETDKRIISIDGRRVRITTVVVIEALGPEGAERCHTKA